MHPMAGRIPTIAPLRRGGVGRRASPRRSPGQAMLEMAIVATVLLTLAFGIIDFGVFFYRYVQAANCARESARRAAVRDPAAESPPYCVDADLQPDVTDGWVDLPGGAEVTATVDATHSWLAISYVVPGMGSTIQITASTSMRMEGKKI